ncbi:hypothetical protein FCL54_10575 [Pseudalkalibacillus caeni]|uniref:DSBA-like thioredoxin domain-containing protein n=1 Tax=Exobacillus caeni TaxID=2574798 RepID=A0A5R9FD47_9BACL|nr:hypothetical protein FCL54_10575 [Pseudalkalibacillus caeni]
MKKEFDIEDEWVSYEIHPETPESGVSLKEKFPNADINAMYNQFNRAGAPYGIESTNVSILSNSQKALEASEYARDQGKFDQFHEEVFKSYFTEGKDIGDTNILLEIAERIGLNRTEMENALEKETYLPTLKEANEEGRRLGVSGTPTFIINGKYKVVGAQPLENFKQALRQLEATE